MGLIDHVVAQVVKTILVVGAVGDVRVVGGLLFFAWRMRQVNAHRQAQKVVQLAHPLRIPAGQIVVDRDHMNTLARDGVEVGGQGRGQGLALACSHFGNFAVVQSNATGHLHIKVAHLHDALGPLAHDRECLWQQIVQALSSGRPLAEILCFISELVVCQAFESRLQCIDALNYFSVLLELTIVATAENFCKEGDGHVY